MKFHLTPGLFSEQSKHALQQSSNGRVCSKDGGGSNGVLGTSDARGQRSGLRGSRLLSEGGPKARTQEYRLVGELLHQGLIDRLAVGKSWEPDCVTRAKKPWGVVPKLSPFPPICTRVPSGEGGTLPSLQRFSSTYSAALLRADTNQAPSKPSPRHQASLPQTRTTAPLPSRLPTNFRILAL